MPVRNAAHWLNETFESLMKQNIDNIRIELSIYNDGSRASVFFCIESYLVSIIVRTRL